MATRGKTSGRGSREAITKMRKRMREGKKCLEKARRCQQWLFWPEGLKNKPEINNGNSTGNKSETCTFPGGEMTNEGTKDRKYRLDNVF